jgi:TrkA domain protein
MDVSETLLPGVGIRFDFVTANRTRVSVVTRRDGRVTVGTYDRSDPDAVTELLTLTSVEAETLAELLGAPRIVERFADLSREIPGLMAARLEIPATSRYAGRELGATRARTRTGVSIVAVVRGHEVVASPGPAEPLYAGDLLVVLGTEEGIGQVRELLTRGT